MAFGRSFDPVSGHHPFNNLRDTQSAFSFQFIPIGTKEFAPDAGAGCYLPSQILNFCLHPGSARQSSLPTNARFFMKSIRLTAETKQSIEEAKRVYIDLKNIALVEESRGTAAHYVEAKDKAFEAYSALTHMLREAYGPSWSIAGSPENEAYRKALRQVEKAVSNKSHEGGHLSDKYSERYLAGRDNNAPGGRNRVAGRDS
jgi:hypothetical protein